LSTRHQQLLRNYEQYAAEALMRGEDRTRHDDARRRLGCSASIAERFGYDGIARRVADLTA
jgi:hypothetical protein